MPETIIIEDTPDEDPSVLAEAAVASAAIAGAAHAEASHASEDAEDAELVAGSALSLAGEAHLAAMDRATPEEARAIAESVFEERMSSFMDQLAARLETAPVAEPKEEEPPPDEPPANLKKRAKKKTFAEKYLGLGDDDA